MVVRTTSFLKCFLPALQGRAALHTGLPLFDGDLAARSNGLDFDLPVDASVAKRIVPRDRLSDAPDCALLRRSRSPRRTLRYFDSIR